MYIDKLDNIITEYNSTFHRTTKIKSMEVKDNTYIDCIKEDNDKDPKFKVSNLVRISKYIKTFLLKDILQIGLKTFL